MNVTLLSLPGRIVWRVSPQDPPVVAQSAEGWMLVNPLVDLAALSQREPPPQILGLHDGDALVSARWIGFAREDEDKDADRLWQFYRRWVQPLRFVSGQATIPQDIVAITYSSLSHPQAVAFPTEQPCAGFIVSDVCETAVNRSRAAASFTILETGGVPPFHEFMLDALAAVARSDYRQTIIYAAIAMEAMVSETLERRNKTNLGHAADARWRATSVRVHANEVVEKDPVYDALRNRESFASLLHEVALYVLERSVLIDNQDLYQSALRAYATRNRLVHTAGAVADDKGLTIDLSGARTALATAVALLDWFGVSHSYSESLHPRLIPFQALYHHGVRPTPT